MASVVKVEGWWRSMANHDSPSFIGQDVREVRVEGLVLVLLVEAHLEGPDLEPLPFPPRPLPLPLLLLELSRQTRRHLNSEPSWTSAISSPSSMLNIMLLVSSTRLTRRRCMSVLILVARYPTPEKSRSRTSYGTSSFTTPRTSIADAARDAAVVTALLYDSMALS
uniref:Uncharacterized protein n=1 Tax=Oryza nivara TaxID=4536 RepID=A0A0E0FPB1_ORYNI